MAMPAVHAVASVLVCVLGLEQNLRLPQEGAQQVANSHVQRTGVEQLLRAKT